MIIPKEVEKDWKALIAEMVEEYEEENAISHDDPEMQRVWDGVDIARIALNIVIKDMKRR